jgi:hypothetical protein
VTRRGATGRIALLALALLLPSFILSADERTDAMDAISPLAAALADGDAGAFLSRFPEDSPNRGRLSDNIRALLAQADLTSSVQLVRLESGRAELDWYLEIRGRARQAVLERRRGLVIVRFRNRALFSIEPVDFFKPSEVR